jgi:hypothetical protein
MLVDGSAPLPIKSIMADWDKKKLGVIGGGALIVLFLVWFAFGRTKSAEQAEHPDGYRMVCQNPSCGEHFTISVAEARKIREHPDQPLKCPKCGQTNVLPEGSKPRPSGPPAPAKR